MARLVIPEVSIACLTCANWACDQIDPARIDYAGNRPQPVLLPRPGSRQSGGRPRSMPHARPDRATPARWSSAVATGVPAGWGAPIYAKLDSGNLAAAMMTINAVKGVENRRRLRSRAPDRRAERRPDAARRKAASLSTPATTQAARRAAFRPGSRWCAGWRSSRPRPS